MFNWTETKGSSRSSQERPTVEVPPVKSNRFRLEELNLDLKPRAHEFWFPEHVTPWFYLRGYAGLSREMRLRYNQLYALGTHEGFIALELDFLYPILKEICASGVLGAAETEAFMNFADEEKKHAEMFLLMNKTAAPDFYRDSNYYLTTYDGMKPFFWMHLISKNWKLMGVWIWLALFFEERTIMYSKEYLRSRTPDLSPLFVQAHRLHMLEEIYHVQLDEVLVERFYEPLGFFRKRAAARMLQGVIRSYLSPRRLSISIAKVLKTEFPDPTAAHAIETCMQELPSLSGNAAFKKQFFGPDATKRVLRLLQKHPEMKPIVDLLRP